MYHAIDVTESDQEIIRGDLRSQKTHELENDKMFSFLNLLLPCLFQALYFRVCAFSIQRTRLSRSLEQASYSLVYHIDCISSENDYHRIHTKADLKYSILKGCQV